MCAPGPCRATYGHLSPRWPVEAFVSFGCASLCKIFHTHPCVWHIFHTQLYHTQLFNFFSFSNLHHLLCLSFLPRPAAILFLTGHSWKKLEVPCCESGMAEPLMDRKEVDVSSLSLSFSDYLPTYLPIYLCIYRSIYLSTYLSILSILSIYLSFYLSFYLSIYLSIYLSESIYLSIFLSIYLSTYLSIYLSLSLSFSFSLYLSLSISMYLYLSLSI